MPLSGLARTQLSLWISQLLLSVPIRSRGTFVELLCACLVSPEGWVTRAISAICRRKHWTTYYKLIERGSIRTVPSARATFSLALAVLAPDAIVLVIDDTLVPRGSLSAPGCAVHFDYARKINRPEYVRTRNRVPSASASSRPKAAAGCCPSSLASCPQPATATSSPSPSP